MSEKRVEAKISLKPVTISFTVPKSWDWTPEVEKLEFIADLLSSVEVTRLLDVEYRYVSPTD